VIDIDNQCFMVKGAELFSSNPEYLFHKSVFNR